MKKYQLFFDMDEVLYNLSEIIIKQYNYDYNDNYDWRNNKHYAWKDTKANEEYFNKILNQTGIFLNGMSIDGAISAINFFNNNDYEIFIISAPILNETCCSEKIKWIKQNFNFINDEHIIFTANKGLLAKSNRILIDDNNKYLQQWNDENGISIAFGGYGWTNWNGYNVKNFEQLKVLINKIEKSGIK